jgi:hypothetical protein
VVSFTPRPFYIREKNRTLGEPRDVLDGFETRKIFTPAGNGTPDRALRSLVATSYATILGKCKLLLLVVVVVVVVVIRARSQGFCCTAASRLIVHPVF